LNARVTGVFQRQGYRLEKIVFESRPGFPVTGHLYIPDGASGTKYPVILNPHGHWGHKKMEPTVQLRLISQALSGYVAFVIDSPGESWEGNNLVERREEGSHWDFPLVVGGAQTTGVYVWDMMRALDYLETRPECDMTRVGLTGASGGGLATMYEFAADERIKVAIPVVYAASMEIAPDNGCNCNHVPATLQIGDRSDVMAIRAPAPVYLIGATNDGEFPPAGTKLSGEKLKKIYALYGAEDRTGWEVFPGPHDYNKSMRERAMGFFNKFLKGVGDGSPVPESEIKTEDPTDPQFLALSPVPNNIKTMRDIARENLAHVADASFADVVALNGGLPKRAPLSLKLLPSIGDHQAVTFQSEAGLTIPGLLWKPKGTPKAGVVLVSENGKIAAEKEFDVLSLVKAGYAVLAIDVRGVGELTGLDLRLMIYLGTSCAFAMATDACAAVDALRAITPKVAVVGSGSAGSQVAMFAGLMDPTISGVAGLQGMKSYVECLNLPLAQYNMDGFMLQPRANNGATLDHLRSLVKCKKVWSFTGDKDKTPLDIVTTLF
jgi:cephalosporin-C deacetylase-like acetyl esterase